MDGVKNDVNEHNVAVGDDVDAVEWMSGTAGFFTYCSSSCLLDLVDLSDSTCFSIGLS